MARGRQPNAQQIHEERQAGRESGPKPNHKRNLAQQKDSPVEPEKATYTVWPDYGPDRIDPTETVVAETVALHDGGAVEFLSGGRLVAYYAAVRSIHRAERGPAITAKERGVVINFNPGVEFTQSDADAIFDAIQETCRKRGLA